MNSVKEMPEEEERRVRTLQGTNDAKQGRGKGEGEFATNKNELHQRLQG